MKRLLPILVLALAGCSSHPGAVFLDRVFPGRVRFDPKAPPFGGVCIPQAAPPPPTAAPGIPIFPVPVGPPPPAVFPGTPPPPTVPPPLPPSP